MIFPFIRLVAVLLRLVHRMVSSLIYKSDNRLVYNHYNYLHYYKGDVIFPFIRLVAVLLRYRHALTASHTCTDDTFKNHVNSLFLPLFTSLF